MKPASLRKVKAMLSEQEVEKQEKAFRMRMERTLASVEVYTTLISRGF
jgi:hypothetical protein